MGAKGLLTISTLSIVILLLIVSQVTIAADNSPFNVKAGDTMTYSVTTSWQSNETGIQKPTPILSMESMESFTVNVESISGSTINYNVTYFFSDGTSRQSNGSTVNVGEFSFVLPTNGSVINAISFPNSAANTAFDTLTRTYGGTQRLVNRIQFTQTIGIYGNVSTVGCWDNQTGISTEQTLSYSSQQENASTTWSTSIKIKSTSLFEISQVNPGISISATTIAIIAGVLVAIIVPSAVVVVLYRKRKNKKSKDQDQETTEAQPLQYKYGPPQPFDESNQPPYYDNPYYKKPYGMSRYQPRSTKPTSYYASQEYHQKPPEPSYIRPGSTTRICPNCKQIISTNSTSCPNCHKKLK
jgi:hypothetical protein